MGLVSSATLLGSLMKAHRIRVNFYKLIAYPIAERLLQSIVPLEMYL